MTFRYRPRPGQARRGQQARPARRHLLDRARYGGRGGRRHGIGQDHPGPPAHPPGRSRTRARSASPGIDLRDVSMASLRRSLVMVPQEPFLYDTTHRRQRPLRAAERRRRRRAAGLRRARSGGLDRRTAATGSTRRSASAATRCRPGSASSSPWPGPTSPTRRAWCWTRPRRPSTRSPRPAWREALDSLARGPHVGHHRPPALDRIAGAAHPRVRPRPPGRARHPR